MYNKELHPHSKSPLAHSFELLGPFAFCKRNLEMGQHVFEMLEKCYCKEKLNLLKLWQPCHVVGDMNMPHTLTIITATHTSTFSCCPVWFVGNKLAPKMALADEVYAMTFCTPCCDADCHKECAVTLSDIKCYPLCSIALTRKVKLDHDLMNAVEYLFKRREWTLNEVRQKNLTYNVIPSCYPWMFLWTLNNIC